MSRKTTLRPWKLWNGWGPLVDDGLMRCERIGPEGGIGGIMVTAGSDMRGTRADFELAASAPALLEACELALQEILDKDSNIHGDVIKQLRDAVALARSGK